MPKSRAAVAQLVGVLSAGSVSGLISVVAAISFASLIFSNTLAPYAETGMGIALFSAGAVALLVALFSSYPGSVAVLHGSTSAVLALMTGKIATVMAGRFAVENLMATVMATIILTTLLTGLVFVLLGAFRLGRLIRYIPYPVVGGFMAGSGWLLVLGSIRVMTGGHGPLSALGAEGLAVLFSGILLACWLLAAERRIRHFVVLPATLVVASIAFHGMARLSAAPAWQAFVDRCRLGPFSGGGLWQFPDFGQLALVHWPAIAAGLPDIGSILLISILSLLLHASSTELAVNQDIDFDTELRTAGGANMVSGLLGGMIGFGSLAYTIIGHTMDVSSRWVGIVSASVCVAALVAGPSVVALFPRPVIGALLLYLGLKLLIEWALASRRSLPASDFAIVWLILLIIATVGFIQGVAAGVLAGIFLFVVKYSAIGVVKNALTGEEYRSNVDRPQDQRYVLLQKGEEILILVLQGFVFFGTANSLLERIREQLGERERLAFIILDFRRVSGMDSSGAVSFAKMRQLAEKNDFRIVLTSVPPAIQTLFEHGNASVLDDARIQALPDLDRGLEYCEDHVLRRAADEFGLGGETLEEYLAHEFREPGALDTLMTYLERRRIEAGQTLIENGQGSNSLLLIDSGRVSAWLTLSEGRSLRLRSMQSGTVVGEIGLYLRLPRTARIVADEPTEYYELTKKRMRRMEREAPEVALIFHRFIVRMLCERMVESNRMLRAVLD